MILFNDCLTKFAINYYISLTKLGLFFSYTSLRNMQSISPIIWLKLRFFFNLTSWWNQRLIPAIVWPKIEIFCYWTSWRINSCICLIEMHFFVWPLEEIHDQFLKLFDENCDFFKIYNLSKTFIVLFLNSPRLFVEKFTILFLWSFGKIWNFLHDLIAEFMIFKEKMT